MDYPNESARSQAQAIMGKAKQVFDAYRERAGRSLVALDWAGIGDACCHARLILQHLTKKNKVMWITKPLVADLFRDDDLMDVVPGFGLDDYRGVGCPWIARRATPDLNNVFEACFPSNPKLHVSYLVSQYWINGGPRENFSELFFRACSIERDFAIKHSLIHLGKSPIEGKYIVMEPTGGSGRLSPEECSKTAKLLEPRGIQVVILGSPHCPKVPGAINKPGIGLYDSFSIIKSAVGFVGKSSGNQSLVCFMWDSQMPLFEVGLNPSISYGQKGCRLYNPDKTIGVPENFADAVAGHYGR